METKVEQPQKQVSQKELYAFIRHPNVHGFNTYMPYTSAIVKGDLAALQNLEALAPELRDEMRLGYLGSSFQLAVAYQQMGVISHLIAHLTPEALSDWICDQTFRAYRVFFNQGFIEGLRFLEKNVAAKDLEKMVCVYNFQALKLALRTGNIALFDHLFSHHCLLAYAEAQAGKYDAYLNPWVDEGVSGIRENPNNKPSPEILYQMLHNLVRRKNHFIYEKDFVFLLGLPELRSLVAADKQNQLLALAIQSKLTYAVRALVAIPEVRDQATQLGMDYTKFIPMAKTIHEVLPQMMFSSGKRIKLEPEALVDKEHQSSSSITTQLTF